MKGENTFTSGDLHPLFPFFFIFLFLCLSLSSAAPPSSFTWFRCLLQLGCDRSHQQQEQHQRKKEGRERKRETLIARDPKFKPRRCRMQLSSSSVTIAAETPGGHRWLVVDIPQSSHRL